MLKHLLLVCALTLAGCALDPPAGVASAASRNGNHHVANAVRCDRIKVICVDASVPALMPTLSLPSVTLPAIPNLPMLPR